jgi:hypothetical protein
VFRGCCRSVLVLRCNDLNTNDGYLRHVSLRTRTCTPRGQRASSQRNHLRPLQEMEGRRRPAPCAACRRRRLPKGGRCPAGETRTHHPMHVYRVAHLTIKHHQAWPYHRVTDSPASGAERCIPPVRAVSVLPHLRRGRQVRAPARADRVVHLLDLSPQQQV